MSFDLFIQKHGEVATQAILEDWERSAGVRHNEPVSLEDRWATFMYSTDMAA